MQTHCWEWSKTRVYFYIVLNFPSKPKKGRYKVWFACVQLYIACVKPKQIGLLDIMALLLPIRKYRRLDAFFIISNTCIFQERLLVPVWVRCWLPRIPRLIFHNILELTKFGMRLRISNKMTSIIRVIAKKSDGDREALRTSGFLSSAVCVQLAKNIRARLNLLCTQKFTKEQKNCNELKTVEEVSTF